jgi:hypothetical protein
MLDIDAITQRNIENGLTNIRLKHSAIRAQLGMGKKD